MSKSKVTAAQTLIMEDSRKKMLYGDTALSLKLDKKLGILPKGLESPFGNFPKHPVRTYSVPVKSKKSTNNSRTGWGSTAGPASKSIYSRQPCEPSELRKAYDRGNLPINIKHEGIGNQILWKVGFEYIDLGYFLPLFFDGIREKENPYRFLAIQGTYDLLENGSDRVLPVVPHLIMPLKKALKTHDPDVLSTVFTIIQHLVKKIPGVGEALVPFYKQLLPVFNHYKCPGRESIGLLAKRQRDDLAQQVEETLSIMEQYGGPSAFVHIKYMVPTYDSYLMA